MPIRPTASVRPGKMPMGAPAKPLSRMAGQAMPDEQVQKPVAEDVADETQKQERPVVPEAIKSRTMAMLEEFKGGADTEDAIRQYREDLETLFPADKRRKRGSGSVRSMNTKKTRDAVGHVSRMENREVIVNRVYRNAQQTLAMICPGDISYRWKPRKTIPKPGAMMGDRNVDETTTQFALTITDRVERNVEEVGFIDTLRACFRHGIWFRVGVMKVTYQRDYFSDEMSEERLPDQQEQVARLQFLTECFLTQQFTKNDAEFDEMVQIAEAIGQGTAIKVWMGISAEVLPLDRWRYDGRIRQLENINAARWQGNWLVMEHDEILSKWPFKLLEGVNEGERNWSGVHPDDLAECSECDEDARIIVQEEQDLRKRQSGGDATRRVKPGSSDTDTSNDKSKKLYPVFECHNRMTGALEWYIPGLTYPCNSIKKVKGPARFFPYHVLNLNPQPNTVYGRSDTELQGPIQDRINRKMSDEEVARWLSIGLRGVIDSANANGLEILDLMKLKPGTLKVMNLQGQKLEDIIHVLESQYNKDSFNKDGDEMDLQRMARFSQSTLGVTGSADFAAEVDSANAGTQQAALDKAFDGQLFTKDSLNTIAELLLQNEPPELVRQESGSYAVWPAIHDEAQGLKIFKEIEDEVAQELNQELAAQMSDAQMAGVEPPEMPDEMALDIEIERRTREKCIERYGFPEPMTREKLFKRLQVFISADLNGAVDRERRVMLLTKLLEVVTKLGGKINMEPLARIMAKLLGEEDELAGLILPDPNELAQTLAQVVQADPSSMTPEGASLIANLAQIAQQYLATAQPADPGADAGAVA